VRATFTNRLFVTPETFFNELFFDDAYNAGLYAQLGFRHYEVTELERTPEGTVRRTVRAEPPVNAPSIVQRRLEGRVFYMESGEYDPRTGQWVFETRPSIAANHTQIRGTIHLERHPEGAIHSCDLEVQVKAFGLGAMIERSIEQNTRESYKLNTEYTNAYARQHGLLAPGAPA